MKVLLSWLQEFAPIEADPMELADHMSDLGMTVEEMTVLEALDGVLVGRVANLRPHPDADRIQLVDVDFGIGDAPGSQSAGMSQVDASPAGMSQVDASPAGMSQVDASPVGTMTHQICCGAFNMAVGDLVPVATVGTVMPDGMKISERKMRGQLSQGMCCSAAELGLGTDHEGIMILPPDLVAGESLMSQLGFDGEVVFDLEINPNRPDAMSVAGVARDLAARLGVPFAIPVPEVVEGDEDVSDLASVHIADTGLCGRFVVRAMHGIKVGESPLWMKLRLALCGMRPINSVVDVSNYVMLELGTPSHTYDLAKVPNGRIGTRRSRSGEQIVTLDNQTRTLAAGDGVIVNGADEPIGIAGVMGGASTEIGEQTDSVLLEMAWWDRASIAATSQRLGLRSEASMRFERGTDWALKHLAADRFCELLARAIPGDGLQVCRGVIDERGELPDRPRVSVRPAWISQLLGQKFDAMQISDLLTPLGFEVELATGNDTVGPSTAATGPAAVGPGTASTGAEAAVALFVTVPTFRPDTTIEADISEEVARHYGYSRLGRSVPRSSSPGRLSPTQQLRRRLRQVLVGEGVSEAMPSPFLAPDSASRAGLELTDPVQVLNPLVTEESVLRPSLLPGLLTAVGYNESHRNERVSLFELGVVFTSARNGAGADDNAATSDERDSNVAFLPVENERLAVILADRGAHAAVQLWASIAAALGIEYSLTNTTDVSYMHPRRAAHISLAATTGSNPTGVTSQLIGIVGELDPSVCERHGIGQRCAWLDVRADVLLAAAEASAVKSYQQVSSYPSSDIDLALVADDSVAAGEVEATLRRAGGAELRSLRLFDVYRGDQLADGQRSLAYRLRLQADDRTLTDSDIASIRQRCIDAVRADHNATLR